jgi:hypothetical protein
VSFKKTIELGEKAMAKSNAIEKSELNKIMEKAILTYKKYEQAIPYLAAYKGKKGSEIILIITNWVMRITSKMILKMLFHNSIKS